MMTPWFDKYTRPHWVGVYETRVKNQRRDRLPSYNFWSGTFWCVTRSEPCDELRYESLIQNIEWRGFTKDQV